MKGILFGSYHSYDDFNLLLVSKEVGSPNVKVKEIDIPGADGVLDLTDFFGSAKYENVTHKFQFQTIVPQNFLSTFSAIKNAIHGKKQRIILDDDPAFYYVGRCFVSTFTNEKNIGILSVECTCEPWKYKLNETNYVESLSGKNLFDFQNPSIVFASGANLTQNDDGLRIEVSSAGTYRYVALRAAPTSCLEGKTVVFKCVPSPSQGNVPIPSVYIGFSDVGKSIVIDQANPNVRSVKLSISKEDAKNYKYLTVWLYANTNSSVNVGTYIDYSNIQLEIGETSTGYEPYDNTEKTISVNVSNSRKSVIPTIISSKNATISKDGYSASLQSERTYQFPEFELHEGNNEFSVTSQGGLISFKYQEGSM